MSKPRIPRQLLGAITAGVIVIFTVGVFAGLIGPNMFASAGHTYSAVFANTQQLKKGDEVRVQGIDEGSVKSITLSPDKRSTTVQMSIANGAGPIYRNATATIAYKTLLGGAFNIEITRGNASAGTLAAGGTIPEKNTADQVELDDLLSVDQGGAERGLRTMLPQLATAFSDAKPLSQTLGTLADVAPAVATGVGALRGVVPDTDLQNLVTGTESTLRALNAPDDQLRTVVQGAAATLSVTAAREADLKSALDEATPAMNQTKTTFAQLRQTFSVANPLLRKLQGSAGQVAPTVKALYPTVVKANTLLHTAVPLLHALPATMRSLATTARIGRPLQNQIQPSLDRLGQTILPYLNTVDPGTDHTTAEMIGPTTEALGPDIAGQEDQNGHFIRFPATAGSSPLYLPCQIYAANPAYSGQQVACSSLNDDMQAFLGYNPVSSLLNSATAASGTSASSASTKSAHATGPASAPSTSSPAGTQAPASTPAASTPSTTGSQTPTTPLGSLLNKILSGNGGAG